MQNTAKGFGWSDKGIGAYNKHLVKVYVDREKRQETFDGEFKLFCEEKMSNTTTRKQRPRKQEGSRKKRALTYADLEAARKRQKELGIEHSGLKDENLRMIFETSSNENNTDEQEEV